MKNWKKILGLVIYTIVILAIFYFVVNKNNNFLKLFKAHDYTYEIGEEEVAYDMDDAYTADTVAETYAATAGSGVFARNTALKMKAEAPQAVAINGGSVPSTDRKIIKNVDISTETRDFDSAIEWLKQYVESFSGIIDNSYVDSGNKENPRYRKNSSFTIRVPAEKLDDFLSSIGTKLNITYQHENIEDITDTYDDTDARRQTLHLEENKLNELMARATTVEDMIKIEEKLSQVRYELQNIERRIKRYDKQIAYSTVTINITEVKELTEITKPEDYSINNLMRQLKKNFESVKQFIVKSFAYLFTHIPAIIFTVLLILVIIGIVAFAKYLTNKKPVTKTAKKDTEVKEVIKDTDKKTTSKTTKETSK